MVLRPFRCVPVYTGNSALSGVSGIVDSSYYDPLSLSGLLTWWEADMEDDDLVLNGSKVATWGAASLTQLERTVDANRPIYVADAGDGLPEVTFNGTSQSLASASTVTISSSFTAFLLFRASATSRMLMEHTTAASDNQGFYHFVLNATSLRLLCRRGSTTAQWTTSGFNPSDDTYRLCVWEHGGTDESGECYVDGVDNDVTIEALGDTGVSDSDDTLYVGARANSSLFMNGGIRAGGVCSPMLSSAERDDATNYILEKWGLS